MKSYINHFFSLKCGPDILPFFNNNHRSAAKEITESFAMWRAALDVLKLDPHEPLIAIVVGDGKRPRTTAVLAHLTKWNCFAIDPLLDLDWFAHYAVERAQQRNPLQRIVVHSCRAEERPIDCGGLRALLVMPHSHASMTESLSVPQNFSRLDAIAMPCCKNIEERYLTKYFALQHQLFTYKDPHVWSPRNTIYVWQNL